MSKIPYDKSSVDSIYQYALRLTGKSLEDAVTLPQSVENAKNRGDLGTLVEKYYFEIEPPNDHNPDFSDAGLELKVTGIIKNKAGRIVAKERLVLRLINYEKIVEEEWEESSFLHKCGKLLILSYLYDKHLSATKRKFILKPILFEIPEIDVDIIRKDWEKIKLKIEQGKAHELSEGDTFYLGACRKGAGGTKEKLRKQPNSNVGAKSRAFSFKQSYVNSIISSHIENTGIHSVSVVLNIEDEVLSRFKPYIGKDIEVISRELFLNNSNSNPKNYRAIIAEKILSLSGEAVLVLEKSGVEMKTIRLKSNGKPRESMSFPGFKFLEILNENWEESKLFKKIESKFLFVVFKEDNQGREILSKVIFWNMPFADREEVKRVWLNTQERVAFDATNLPKMSESSVAHVRPKGRNGQDKLPTPQGGMHLRQCFWLNSSYIHTIIESS